MAKYSSPTTKPTSPWPASRPILLQKAPIVQGDNPTDAPEFVVTKGRFDGTLDFTLVTQFGYGTATGTLTTYDRARVPFTGTVRVPLGVPNHAVYVNLSGGTPRFVPVQPGEYAGGWPMVRFDLRLEHE